MGTSLSSTLRNILLDGGAGYNPYTTSINFPSESFGALGRKAQLLVGIDLPCVRGPQSVSPMDFLPFGWGDTEREIFYILPIEDRLDVCAFVTSVLHECCHHMDLLRTPFGASFHEKLCREYLAFQKWTPTLLGAPVGFFDTPLVDWAGSALAGPTETGRLLVGSQLEQALVYLRGSIAFDEVRRGALPRHVSEGWAGNTKPFILTGKRKYKRLTVNQVWVTIGLEQEPGYLSPDAIIEGRTLALCLIYLLHLLGDDATAIETIRRYVERFYVGQSKYLALLEIHSGLDAVSLFNESADILKRRLWESVANGWYSLHAPVIVKQDDVSQSMTARCVQAARAMRDNDILSFSSVGAFLSAMDSKFSELGARPIKEALAVSAERLAKTISMCADCRDIEMREWYQHILQVIHDDLLQRIPAGYELRTGLPPDGNPMRWVDDAGMRCVELQVAPRRVTEWYELRQLLLTTRDQAKEKAQKLSDFFVNRVQ